MQVRLRRLNKDEPDHELIWLCVTITTAALAFAWLWLNLPWPRCTFHDLLGIPCLTCGSTRAALALAHGDLQVAWEFNPLATLALSALALFDVYALGVLATGARRLRLSAPRRFVLPLLAGAALLNWIYLLRHA